MKNYTFLLLLVIIVSCQSKPQQEQKLEQLDKKSAREVLLTAIEKGDTIYHLTQQKIWSDNQLVAEKTDTIKTVKAWNDSIKTPIYVTVQ